jgi:hypothetical protein
MLLLHNLRCNAFFCYPQKCSLFILTGTIYIYIQYVLCLLAKAAAHVEHVVALEAQKVIEKAASIPVGEQRLLCSLDNPVNNWCR